MIGVEAGAQAHCRLQRPAGRPSRGSPAGRPGKQKIGNTPQTVHPRCPRYLGDICRDQEPPWRTGEGGHRIYCHIPLEELARLQADTLVLAPDPKEA